VLEHIDRCDFDALVFEMKRVMRPGGVMSHEVDLRDHLGGGKNNMRFPAAIWESAFFKRAGFYTNRIACSEIKVAFLQHGFELLTEEVTTHVRKTSRKILAKEFANISDADLDAAILKVTLRA